MNGGRMAMEREGMKNYKAGKKRKKVVKQLFSIADRPVLVCIKKDKKGLNK